MTPCTEWRSGKGGIADVGYAYDALNRVVTETSNGVTHHYRHDLAGNRLGTKYGLAGGGDGRVITSSYDALNRLSSMSEGGRVTSYSYDLNGNIRQKTLPNGETVKSSFDGLNRRFTDEGTIAQTSLYRYVSISDAVGNLRYSSETTANVPARAMVLDYDKAHRLVSEKVYSESHQLVSTTIHGYSAANNRTSKVVNGATTTYSYNNLNQLTGWSGPAGDSGSFTYDLNGNRATRTKGGQTDTYGYDVENRLVSLAKNTTGGTGSYSYVYDYRTRRVSRNENAVTTNFVFSGGTSVQEYSAGALTVDYVRGSDWGGGVGGVLYSMRLGNPSFAHYNNRGDVTTRTDGSGTVTWQASYQADGKRTAEAGSTSDRQMANTKEEEPTGLLNEGFRYRDLEALTFITRDPAGFVDGPNLYAYVRQNPWSKFDPEGLETSDYDYEWQHNIPQGKAADLARKAGIERNSYELGSYMTKADHRLIKGEGIHTTGVDGDKLTWHGEMNRWAEEWERDNPGRRPTKQNFKDQIDTLKQHEDFRQQFSRSVPAKVDYKPWKKLKDGKQVHARGVVKDYAKQKLKSGVSNKGGKAAVLAGVGILFSCAMAEASGENAEQAKEMAWYLQRYQEAITADADVGGLAIDIGVKAHGIFDNEPSALVLWNSLIEPNK